MVGLILFLLLPGDGSVPDADAFLSALRQEVGAQTQIIVERYTGNPTVAGLRARRRELAAQFGAFVACEDQKWTNARLVLVGEDVVASPVVRTLDFVPADPPHERARAMGLLLASMMRELDPRIPLAQAKAPPALPMLLPEPQGQAIRHWVGAMGTSQRTTNTGSWAWGAELSWRAQWAARWSSHLGLFASRGQITAIPGQVTDMGFRVAAGAVLLRHNGPRRLVLRTILGAGVMREAVNRRDTDDAEVTTKTLWKPATTFDFELEVSIASGLSAVARAGFEAHLVESRVLVDRREVATMAQIRPVLALGVGWSF